MKRDIKIANQRAHHCSLCRQGQRTWIEIASLDPSWAPCLASSAALASICKGQLHPALGERGGEKGSPPRPDLAAWDCPSQHHGQSAPCGDNGNLQSWSLAAPLETTLANGRGVLKREAEMCAISPSWEGPAISWQQGPPVWRLSALCCALSYSTEKTLSIWSLFIILSYITAGH